MLRITTTNCPQALTLQLEGRLEGPWVEVLAQCWSAALLNSNGRPVRIDLNGVTFVDGHGKALLAKMHAQGAEFLAGDLETKAIVAEIQTRRANAVDGESRQQ
jgi:anti-anti-sigma regulatory factor